MVIKVDTNYINNLNKPPMKTIITWNKGTPKTFGKFLVYLYTGAIDIDFYRPDIIAWDKYKHDDIIIWSELGEIEKEINKF